MGYYTNYTLTVLKSGKPAKLPADTSASFPIEDLLSFGRVNAIKWYHHEDDMKAFSLQYPDYVFQLDGEGEDFPDVWRKYFKDGKMAKYPAQITFPDFLESDLS